MMEDERLVGVILLIAALRMMETGIEIWEMLISFIIILLKLFRR